MMLVTSDGLFFKGSWTTGNLTELLRGLENGVPIARHTVGCNRLG